MGFFRFSSVSLAGPGFVILNGLKVVNIICFLFIVCAHIVMLIRIRTESAFFFFDAVRHVITIGICFFLTLSEIPVFPKWYERNWPTFGLEHGFVTLGLAMIAVGVETLGNLNESTNSQDNLGMAFWRIVIGSGILTIIFGVFNIIASFVFRDRICDVSARQVRAFGKPAIIDARARVEAQARGKSLAYTPSAGSTTSRAAKSPRTPASPSSKKSPKRWTHRFNLPILPSYNQSQKGSSPVASSKYTFRDSVQDHEHEPMPAMKISAPLNPNPHFANMPGLIRPDSAYHPYRSARP